MVYNLCKEMFLQLTDKVGKPHGSKIKAYMPTVWAVLLDIVGLPFFCVMTMIIKINRGDFYRG